MPPVLDIPFHKLMRCMKKNLFSGNFRVYVNETAKESLKLISEPITADDKMPNAPKVGRKGFGIEVIHSA